MFEDNLLGRLYSETGNITEADIQRTKDMLGLRSNVELMWRYRIAHCWAAAYVYAEHPKLAHLGLRMSAWMSISQAQLVLDAIYRQGSVRFVDAILDVPPKYRHAEWSVRYAQELERVYA